MGVQAFAKNLGDVVPIRLHMVKYKFIKTTFIKKFFHQNPLSSKTTFIKNHFHQKPISSKCHFHQNATFIKNHFHQKPFSSKTIFIKNHFHQKPISSETTFIKNHFHQKPISSKPISSLPVRRTHHQSKNNTVRVCVKASWAEGPRRLHTNTALCQGSGKRV